MPTSASILATLLPAAATWLDRHETGPISNTADPESEG
jgi:hypothetical protein